MPNRARELFVISDLHIGGRYGATASERGFRINTHVTDLVSFVGAVAAHTAKCTNHVELVINGDFVDFLAEEGTPERRWRAFIDDPAEALRVFERVVEQDRALFSALRELLKAGADLTLLLGNHDVELYLPAVRRRLVEILQDGPGRLQLFYDGEAYAVGEVLIEHGNRYDGYNVIDHDRLREVRSAQSRRQSLSDGVSFEPPPGSRLVEQVMNPIKADYAFVDLLKPETEAVVPLLIALEPGFAADIERIWRLWRLKSAAAGNAPSAPAWPAHAGHIGTAIEAPRSGLPVADATLASMLRGTVEPTRLDRLIRLADSVAARDAAGDQRVGLREDLRRAWSMLRLSRGDSKWSERRQVLLDALRTLQNDTSFDTGRETPEYLGAAHALSSNGFRLVVFGHTHLAKEVRLDNGALYVNTGTWADLMRVPSALFAADETLALAELDRFIDALQSNRIGPYLMFRPSFAQAVVQPGGKLEAARLSTSVPADLNMPAAP